MPNTNFQTILQMPGIVNDIVKQATGRNSVSQIDMDFVTVAQDKQTVPHEIDFTALAHFVNNNQLPLTVLAKITLVQSGEGDPTPENVRPITGWTGVTITQTGEDTENEYTVTFPKDVGTVYGGILNVTTGVLTVNRAMVDLGTLTWTYITADTVFYATLSNKKEGFANGRCSIYKVEGLTGYATPDYVIGQSTSSSLTKRIFISNPNYTNAATFKTAMSGIPFVYELATPVTVQLTATEIDSLIGENNLSADTGEISVSYTSYIPVP